MCTRKTLVGFCAEWFAELLVTKINFNHSHHNVPRRQNMLKVFQMLLATAVKNSANGKSLSGQSW